MAVAVKYADGDLNWAQQVANNLGVSPQTKLSEVSARSGLTSLSPLAAGVQPVAMANPAGKR
jgi:hypothetical protein